MVVPAIQHDVGVLRGSNALHGCLDVARRHMHRPREVVLAIVRLRQDLEQHERIATVDLFPQLVTGDRRALRHRFSRNTMAAPTAAPTSKGVSGLPAARKSGALASRSSSSSRPWTPEIDMLATGSDTMSGRSVWIAVMRPPDTKPQLG